MAQKPLTDPETDNLVKYFTDVEYLRDLFARFIATEQLPKRILTIRGVGGVGKSSLLRMFRLHAKNVHIPIALTSAEEAKSALEVLSNWSSDLKADGVALGNFQKTLVHYKAIQTKVEDQAKKAQEARKKTAEKVGTAVAKAVIGAAISLIPGGQLVNVLGGIGVDALVDWLSGFLTKPDIDLLLDPTKALSKDFLEDIAKVARKRRVVLMLDTFEQMSALNDWVCDLAKQLDRNILLVIAGREMVNWDRQWDGWLAHTQVEELEPMTEEHMRELARRYYATMVGGEPDTKQVEAIIAFSRGLPMVVATAVRLWVKYRQEFDIEEHKVEVYSDVVKRLREGVSSEFLPIMEAAAIVRWFDMPILRAVTGLKDVSAVYEELRRFPFVKSSREGLRFHDSVRDIMDASLRVDDSVRYKELHKRAAAYFQKQLDLLFAIPGLSDEWQRLALEVSYHLNLSNESKGIDFFHKSFGQGLAYFRYQFCRQLIVDSESIKLANTRNLHRLKFDKIRLTIAEFSPAYVTKEEFDEVVAKSDVDPSTKWEVLFDYANFLGFIAKPDEQAKYFRQSLDALKSAKMEESSAGCVIVSAVASTHLDEPSKRIQLNKRAIDISKRIGEPFIAYNPYVDLGHAYLDIGNYLKAEKSWRAALDIAQKYSNDAKIADAFNRIAHALMATGRLSEAEEVLNSALFASKRLPDTLGAGRDKEMYIKRHLGMLYQMRGEYDKAIQYYSESVQIYRERRSTGGRLRTLVLLAGCLFEMGRHDDVGSLSQEIELCAAKLRISEMVAGWQAIEGHLLVSDLINGRTSIVDDVISTYGEALKTALQAHIPVVYEIMNRMFWRLNLRTKAEAEQDVIRVLQGLAEYWRNGEIEGKSLLDVETEKRQKFTRGREKISIEPQVLTQLETALVQGLPKRKPAPWLAY